MVIQTFEKGYTVVRYLESNMQWDIFICKEGQGIESYQVIRIKDKKIVYNCMDFIYQQVGNTAFLDMTDCFTYEEQLHLVFRHYEGTPLDQKTRKEHCSFEERLEIGKRILERLVLLKMPEFFQFSCLQKENILVSESLQVNFHYSISGIEHYAGYTREQVWSRILNILSFLFEQELKNKVLGPMSQLLDKIEKKTFGDYLSLYQAYCDICEEMKQIPEKELLLPRTKVFKLWERMKSWQKVLKRAAMFLAFLTVFGYMIYNIYLAFLPMEVEDGFAYIGTVTIEK